MASRKLFMSLDPRLRMYVGSADDFDVLQDQDRQLIVTLVDEFLDKSNTNGLAGLSPNPERDYKVTQLYFFEGLSSLKVGDAMGISNTSVLQLRNAINRRCRRYVNERKRTDGASLLMLDLSERTFILLRRSNINTIEDLVERSREDLSRIWQMGKPAIAEIESALAARGFHLHAPRPKDEE